MYLPPDRKDPRITVEVFIYFIIRIHQNYFMCDLVDYHQTLKFMPFLEMKKKIKMEKKKLYHLVNIWKKLMKEQFNKEKLEKKSKNNNSSM